MKQLANNLSYIFMYMEEENARLVTARISNKRRFENQYVLFGLFRKLLKSVQQSC
jgi:hypothetical protein